MEAGRQPIAAQVAGRGVAAAARAVTGACGAADLVIGGRDFAGMLAARPGAYILAGHGATAPLHWRDSGFADAAIPARCSFRVEIAEPRLRLS